MSAKEAKARIKINKLLEDAGWRFFDNEFGPANIQVEANVKLSKTQIDALGDNFEKTKNGFVDFLLLDENGKPFIVLEAKSEDYDPLAGKEQARKYAKSQFVKYVILSNGNIHYFWNIYKGSPQVIITFPTYESVKESYDLTYFSKDETGVSLWLGQAKLGGKAYCKTDINKDLLEKFTAEYLSKQIFFVCEKRVSLTDDTKAILEAIEEINIRSMEDDATLRGKKLLDYFKSEGIRIKIPCLLAYGEETVYKDARALCQMIDRETDSIRDYFNAHTYAFQGFSPEIVFYVFPIESIERLRDKEAGFYAGLC